MSSFVKFGRPFQSSSGVIISLWRGQIIGCFFSHISHITCKGVDVPWTRIWNSLKSPKPTVPHLAWVIGAQIMLPKQESKQTMGQSSCLGLHLLPQLAFGVSPSRSWQGGSTCGEASIPPPPSPRGRPLMSSRSLSQRPGQTRELSVASLRQQLSAHLHNRFCTLDPDGLNVFANPCGEINPVSLEEFHVGGDFLRIL